MNRTILFLQKYRFVILLLFIFISLQLYFVPVQNNYYFDHDINRYLDQNYPVIASIILGFLLLPLIVISIIKRANFKIILTAAVYFLIMGFFTVFMTKKTVSSFFLFVNRQFPKKEIVRSYRVYYIQNDRFEATSTDAFEKNIDQNDYYKYSGRSNANHLHNQDILTFHLQEGLLGIPFFIPGKSKLTNMSGLISLK